MIYQYDPVYATRDTSLERVLLINNHDFTYDEIGLLRAFGDLTTVAGPVGVFQTTKNLMNEVRRLPFISKTTRPNHMSVQLDKSVPDVGAPLVWQKVRDAYGRNVTGRGVIVGFVDTGIDTTHPDFTFPNGTTKILFIWDQTNQGRPPSGFTYGFECSSSDIESETCREVDTFGHGTHTVGITTSSGAATGNYTGVAPEAGIIFVKSGYQICNGSSWTFDDAQILDGINYIIRKSHELGRRAVINLSLGGNIGGHDGTSPLEQALDAFVRDGTPIVVAAGNEATTNSHVRGQLKSDTSVSINLEVRPNTTDLQIDSWYSTQDDINATLISPGGQTFQILNVKAISHSTFGNISVTRTSTSLGQEVLFEISSSHSIPETGWSVRLTAKAVRTNGAWNSWIDAESCSFPAAFFLPGGGYEIDRNDTIGIPGTAHNVVTVGAYVTKTSWLGLDGNKHGSTTAIDGQIASFSSLGPTRDGRVKPDIVAPGMFIASARSRLVPLGTNDPDQFHRILSGTSMAAPHVAGIIALILQYSPSIPAMQIVTLLRDNAREDSFTSLLPSRGSEIWGSGKADARTATGFYRLTVTSSGVPDSVIFPVIIDHVKTSLRGGSWRDDYFLKGSTHHVSFDNGVVTQFNVRYSVSRINLTMTSSLTEVLAFKQQYYVNVTSIFGPAKGSGWYDANTTTTLVEAPMHLEPNWYVGLLGGRLTQIGWITGEGTIVSSREIRVDHPMTLMAFYIVTYKPQVVATLLPIGSLLLVILRPRRHGSRPEMNPSSHSNPSARSK
jgi:subtilisin family serine protease